MAVQATLAGGNAQCYPGGIYPATQSLAVPVVMTPGDWLVACVTWRQPPGTVWTFAVSGTPVAAYFTVSAAQAASITVGQQFTDTFNPGVIFTVTSLSAPAFGFVNVFFTPSAKVIMATGDTVTQAGVTCSVADGANWWDPLGQPSGTSSAAGVTRCAIWAAPAARTPPQGQVMIAPTGFVTGLGAVIYDVSGISPWSVLELISAGFANAATALSLSLAAPAGNSVVLAVAGSDNIADTVSLAAGGWSSVTVESASNGIDHTVDITVNAATQITTGATTAAWSSTGALDFSGVIAAIAVTGTQPTLKSSQQPYTVTEIAPGAGPGTPPDQLTWVPLTGRVLASGFTQGRGYTLGQLQAGQGTLTLDNPNQDLIPPGSGAFAGIDSGTPFRTRAAWPGGAWQVQFSGNGSTAQPQVTTGIIFPVTAGVTYSASAWLACTPAWASGVALLIVWRTSGGTLISSTASASVTTAAAVLATASGVAPATATQANILIQAGGTPAAATVFTGAAAPPGTAWLQPPPAVAWTAQNSATSSILAPWREDSRGAPNVTPWYVDSAGYFQRWPPTWPGEMLRGQTVASTTDIWGYANTNLASILRTEVLNDGPYGYWPCSDPLESGINLRATTGASNIAPGNSKPLNVVLSKNGTGGTAIQEFGQNSGALPGDTITTVTTTQRLSTQGTMWAQTGVPSTGLNGYSLSCTDAGYPSVTNGVTVEGWFQWAGGAPIIGFLLSLMNTTGNVLNVYAATTSPYLVLQSLQNAGAVNSVNLITTPGIPSGLFHVAVAFSRTTYSAYVNGALVASGTWTHTLPANFNALWLNGNWAAAGRVGGGVYNGYTAHVALTGRMLAAGRILTHYQAGALAMAGEAASYRVERLLQAAALPGRRAILPDVTTPVVSCQDIGNEPASTSLTNIAASTVPAILGVRPTGDIIYTARSSAYNDPVMWVLGDNQAAGEIPFLPDYAPDYDPGRVVNDISITQLDDQSVTVPDQAALEAASRLAYGDVTYQPTGYLQNDPLSAITAGPGTQDLADWIAATNAKPQLRAASVTVDASKHPAAWPFVLAAGIGDGITVNIRPATAGGQLVTVTGRITQTTRARQFDQSQVAGSVQVVIDTAPDLNVLTADDPVRGQLTGGNVLAW
jgi:hypothetical protein